MSRVESFDIEVGGGVVAGVLHEPDDGARPAVLLVNGPPGTLAHEGLTADTLAEALPGIAVARYEPRRDDNGALRDPATAVDDAAAVLHWLLVHEHVDARCVGLLGEGLGAVVAACLAGRTDRINRVCLLAPVTPDEALARITRNGAPPLVDTDIADDAYRAALGGMDGATALATHAPPTLVLHGAADRVAPPSSATPYLAALASAGRAAEHELVARADHGFTGDDARSVCLDRIERFFSLMTPST
jgi:pimeloyl-ACP methyl ester carboxylesterase